MLRLIVACILLTAAAVPANAQQDVFLGTWTVAKAEDAPWLKVRPDLKPDYARVRTGVRIVISTARLEGPLNIGCRNPRYTETTLAPDTIFEGGLSDPAHGLNDAPALARQLGFTSDRIATLESRCSEQQFHLADRDTILFARNNIVYTLKRAKVR